MAEHSFPPGAPVAGAALVLVDLGPAPAGPAPRHTDTTGLGTAAASRFVPGPYVLVAKAIPPVDVPAAIEELGRGRPERFVRARAAGSVQVIGQPAHGLTNSVITPK
ncbi:hypothetical protein [Streptomyces katrae]|uniref:hypothetical protein n=1 Tax=Streptomyces katrae TaxID=68223 RepID=UPI0004BE9CB9|nr:hypothetical protein [Streptomyces katrae]